MTQSNEQGTEKKKVSLKEAMMQQLANKKQQAQAGATSGKGNAKVQKMNSQQTKKVNNQRRRTGV